MGIEWVLSITLYVAGDVYKEAPLFGYESHADCLAHRDYVQYQMEVAYPGEVDWQLQCKPYEEPPSIPDTINLQEVT